MTNALVIARRIAFIGIAMDFHNQIWVQSICFVVISSGMMIFYVNVQPFAERLQNKVEIASEILVLVIGYHMVTFAGFNMGNAYR